MTIPARQHVRLHSRKLLEGVEISDTFEEAVQAYLRRLEADGQDGPDARGPEAGLVHGDVHAEESA